MIGIILSAGKGSRLKCTTQNKTTLTVAGKPLIQFGVELFENLTDKTVIVVGAFADSVINAVKSKKLLFAFQRKRLGTGHALKVAIKELEKNKINTEDILVGYGDHMASYSKKSISRLINQHKNSNSVITLIACEFDRPNELAWGRIVTNSQGKVIKIVEQKDATEGEKRIKLLNAGFYCFDFKFVKKYINKLTKSETTKEYYLTELISIAIKNNLKVQVFIIPYEEVGIGINTMDQYVQIQQKSSQQSPNINIFSRLWQTFPKIAPMKA